MITFEHCIFLCSIHYKAILQTYENTKRELIQNIQNGSTVLKDTGTSTWNQNYYIKLFVTVSGMISTYVFPPPSS